MSDPLEALDAPSRRTVEAFMDATQQYSADGMKALFTADCEFIGALSGGKLRGRQVIESHYRQAFKGISSRGATVLRHASVNGREVVFEWEILDPADPGSGPVQGRTTLDLDDAGLIARIRTEWDPRQIQSGKT